MMRVKPISDLTQVSMCYGLPRQGVRSGFVG
jgi:hypothetical protein